jgi:hypothetical protein
LATLYRPGALIEKTPLRETLGHTPSQKSPSWTIQNLGGVNALVSSFSPILKILAVPLASPLLVHFKITFTPIKLAISLEGQNMGC